MTNFVGLDISQKTTAICVVDNSGCRLWRGQCPSNPERSKLCVLMPGMRVPLYPEDRCFLQDVESIHRDSIHIAPGQTGSVRR